MFLLEPFIPRAEKIERTAQVLAKTQLETAFWGITKYIQEEFKEYNLTPEQAFNLAITMIAEDE